MRLRLATNTIGRICTPFPRAATLCSTTYIFNWFIVGLSSVVLRLFLFEGVFKVIMDSKMMSYCKFLLEEERNDDDDLILHKHHLLVTQKKRKAIKEIYKSRTREGLYNIIIERHLNLL